MILVSHVVVVLMLVETLGSMVLVLSLLVIHVLRVLVNGLAVVGVGSFISRVSIFHL